MKVGSLTPLDIFIILGLSLCVIGALLVLIFQLEDFFSALRVINMEIRRTEGKEQAYWRRERRRLLRSLLFPFIKK